MRPATRVDNIVIFEGGRSRSLSRLERLRLFLFPRSRVSTSCQVIDLAEYRNRR